MSGGALAIVGIGEDGLAGLGPAARAQMAVADLFVGGRRHLDFLGADSRPRLAWRSPLEATLGELAGAAPHRRIVVLASGDPLWHGVGSLLLRRFPSQRIELFPAVSAFQLAAARLGWPLDEITTLSLHARPLDLLHRHLVRGARLLCLTSGADDPAAIAILLAEAGFGAAGLIVLERLGGAAERVVRGTGTAPPPGPFDALNLVAVDLQVPDLPRGRAAGAWLPDDAFEHDGQLTKAEIRAVTLARLAPAAGELLWDVGAGSGSIGIAWLCGASRARAVAIEARQDRVQRIARNAAALGAPELQIVLGRAPACLTDLPDPDAVFVGGGLAEPGLLAACWARLSADGRLVANAVTLAGEAALLAFRDRHGGNLIRLSIARAEPVGPGLAWRPLMPVTQLQAIKPCVAAA